MDPDLVVQVKCTVFWLNWGFRVYLNLLAIDFPKRSSMYLFGLNTVLVQNTLFLRHSVLFIYLHYRTSLLITISQYLENKCFASSVLKSRRIWTKAIKACRGSCPQKLLYMDIFELLKRKEHLTYVHYTYCSTLLSILCTLQVFTITLHFRGRGGGGVLYDMKIKD